MAATSKNQKMPTEVLLPSTVTELFLLRVLLMLLCQTLDHFINLSAAGQLVFSFVCTSVPFSANELGLMEISKSSL